MAHTVLGTYTIKEALIMTKQHPTYRNRFEYEERDRVKLVSIRKIHYFQSQDRLGAPVVKFQVTTQSKPFYKPYVKVQKNGKVVQKNIKHHYDITFECDRLSINTKNWQIMVGSGKNYDRKKVPQSKVQSIFKENLKRWSKERIETHRKKKGLYLTPEDYAAQVLGVNLDWRMRVSWVMNLYGHRLGREYNLASTKPPVKTNPSYDFFLPKHAIAFFDSLMRAGILKDD